MIHLDKIRFCLVLLTYSNLLGAVSIPDKYISFGYNSSVHDTLEEGSRKSSQKVAASAGFVYEQRFNLDYGIAFSALLDYSDFEKFENLSSSYTVSMRKYYETGNSNIHKFMNYGLYFKDFQMSSLLDERGVFVGGGYIYGFVDDFSLQVGVNVSTDYDNGTVVGSPFLQLSYYFDNDVVKTDSLEVMVPMADVTPVLSDVDSDGVDNASDICPGTLNGVVVDSDGCPSALDTAIRKTVHLQYDVNSFIPSEEYSAQLKDIAVILLKYPSSKVELIGHTDDVGSEDYNNRLSLQRANFIKIMLVKQFNVLPSRITSTGYGESVPLIDDDSVDARTLNRRLEIIFLP